MMTLDTIMANMPLAEREIIMDKMVKASRDIFETIADMGYIDQYETSLTAMEKRGYQDELGEMDIDQIQADGYEFGMDLAFGKARAKTLIEAAEHSVGSKEGAVSARMEIRMLLEDYESRNIRLQEVMALIEGLVKQIPMAEKLLEIKGVGIRTVSGFLAEVGDISRFNNPKELQKLAGLALVENSSGKHKGETTISRRGRKRLRYLLFEVAMSLVAKNPEFRELHNYYTTRRLNPLKKMQSLMAIAAKLIRVFYAMLTKGVDYDPKKMVSDIKRPAVYIQAA